MFTIKDVLHKGSITVWTQVDREFESIGIIVHDAHPKLFPAEVFEVRDNDPIPDSLLQKFTFEIKKSTPERPGEYTIDRNFVNEVVKELLQGAPSYKSSLVIHGRSTIASSVGLAEFTFELALFGMNTRAQNYDFIKVRSYSLRSVPI